MQAVALASIETSLGSQEKPSRWLGHSLRVCMCFAGILNDLVDEIGNLPTLQAASLPCRRMQVWE